MTATPGSSLLEKLKYILLIMNIILLIYISWMMYDINQELRHIRHGLKARIYHLEK